MNNERIYPTIAELQFFKKVHPPENEIGIEIEIEGKNLEFFPNNRIWKKTQDGSLRGEESAEYILYNPIPINDVEKQITKLVNTLKKIGAKKELSDRCGVHIHINVQHMTYNELINFICLYLVLEPLLVSYCGKSREGNMFCLRAKDAAAIIDLIMLSYKESSLDTLINRGNAYRYASINLSSVRKHGSLEFRAFKTPKNFKSIITWANLLYKVKTSSYKFQTPEEIINSYSMYEYEEFLNNIFEEQAPILFNLSNINRKLIEGIRLVQDIAYANVLKQPIKLSDLKKKNEEEINTNLRWNLVNEIAEVAANPQPQLPVQEPPPPPPPPQILREGGQWHVVRAWRPLPRRRAGEVQDYAVDELVNNIQPLNNERG